MQLTLAAKEGRQVPELGHVVSLEDLTLVAGTITVEDDAGILSSLVLVGKSKTSTDRNLSTDDTIATIETLGEHVHGTALAVGNTLTSAKKLANDGLDSSTTHQCETVASVGSDNVVLLGNGMFNTNSDGFLSSRQVAETSNLLLLVQTIGRHLHLSIMLLASARREFIEVSVPNGNHIVVHLLELLLGHLQGVRGGIKLVGLEALIGESNGKGLILRLSMKESITAQQASSQVFPSWEHTVDGGAKMFGKPASRTSGTEWLNDADAALVVTERVAIETGAVNLARRDIALGTRRALDNMASFKVPLFN